MEMRAIVTGCGGFLTKDEWIGRIADRQRKGKIVPTRTDRQTMKRGLFRTFDSFLGECARVHEDAGDAFPYLRPDLYRLLGFQPAYEDLPLVPPPAHEYRRA